MNRSIAEQPIKDGQFYSTEAIECFGEYFGEATRYKLLREKRNYLLKLCDWTVGLDSPLTDVKKQEWIVYRQALRDVPQNTQATNKITWPVMPTV
jgi:hypothetical protein